MHYKYQFLQLTIEFYYRFVVPSPLSIVVQILSLIKKDFRKNPFGTNFLACKSNPDCSGGSRSFIWGYSQGFLGDGSPLWGFRGEALVEGLTV